LKASRALLVNRWRFTALPTFLLTIKPKRLGVVVGLINTAKDF